MLHTVPFRNLISTAVIIMTLAFAPVPARAQMTQVNNGTAAAITGPTYGCRVVTNNSGYAIMVPWNTAAEWLTVINTPGPGVSLSGCTCDLPWGGTISSGQSVTAYLDNWYQCGETPTSESRTCSGGSLSGSYPYGAYATGACSACAPLTRGKGITATANNVLIQRRMLGGAFYSIEHCTNYCSAQGAWACSYLPGGADAGCWLWNCLSGTCTTYNHGSWAANPHCSNH